MISHFRQLTSYRRAIAALLVLAVFSNAILAGHYHLSHDAESMVVDTKFDTHAVNLHSVVDAADADHHQSDVHTLESAEFPRVKASGFLVAQLALFFCLSLLLFPTPVRRVCLRSARDNFRLPRLYWRNTPPLRAPPGV